MSKELGDSWSSGPQLTRTVESDGTNLSEGDAVTIDASQQVGPTGDGDDLYGVVAGPANNGTDLSNLSAGDELSVVVHGPVIANVGGSVTNGDLVETSSTSGQLAQNSTGTEQDVDEGGTATYTLALNTARAYSDAGGSIDGGSLGANEAALFVDGS
jgi:hypothetical protein